MPQHLLLISLGPVQDFIASARRCQDLWFGSYLLSDLSRATAQDLERQVGATALIFPAALGNDKPAVANKILVCLPDGVSPATAAQQAREAMGDRLEELADEAFAGLETDRRFHERVARQQINDLMEFQWVSLPLPDPGGYAAVREQAEALLASRKNTRLWGPVPWERPYGIPKSSLDGARESVLDESLYDDLKQGRVTAEEARRRYGISRTERLCGIGLLKRLGCELALAALTEEGEPPPGRAKPAFHSSSHMAAAPLLTRLALLGKPAQEALARYQQRLRELGLDLQRLRIRTGTARQATLTDPLGQPGPVPQSISVDRTFSQRNAVGLDGSVLYEDRLSDLFEEHRTRTGKDSHLPLDRAVEEARQALRGFLRSLGVSRPPIYYALLQADGDRMGQAIQRLGQSAGMAGHRRLAQALEQFAIGCQPIVEGHAGSLIYAGGDDVLALLPLHTAASCADALRKAFVDALASAVETLPAAERPTLSVGLAIAHHLEPMSFVRELAQRAERLAKQERDSLAVIVSKRSGGDVERSARWSAGLVERLHGWCQLLGAEELPDGIAFELEELCRPFELRAPGEEVADQGGAVLFALVRRAVGRKRQQRGAELLANTVADLLLVQLGIGAVLPEPTPVPLGEALERVRQLSAELQIARVLLDGWTAAWAVARPGAAGEAQ